MPLGVCCQGDHPYWPSAWNLCRSIGSVFLYFRFHLDPKFPPVRGGGVGGMGASVYIFKDVHQVPHLRMKYIVYNFTQLNYCPEKSSLSCLLHKQRGRRRSVLEVILWMIMCLCGP